MESNREGDRAEVGEKSILPVYKYGELYLTFDM